MAGDCMAATDCAVQLDGCKSFGVYTCITLQLGEPLLQILQCSAAGSASTSAVWHQIHRVHFAEVYKSLVKIHLYNMFILTLK